MLFVELVEWFKLHINQMLQDEYLQHRQINGVQLIIEMALEIINLNYNLIQLFQLTISLAYQITDYHIEQC